MKKIILICLTYATFAYAARTLNPTPSATSTKVGLADFYQQQEKKYFFPDSLPTNSIFEKTLEDIYGAKGLNLETPLVTQIKQLYCFFEFILKLYAVEHDHTYAIYKENFTPFLTPSVQVQYPTQTLISSKAYQAIKIEPQDFVHSILWQNILTTSITDGYTQNSITLEIIHQAEGQVFDYLPGLEVNFYNYDFVRLKNLTEFTRLKALLQYNIRNRNLEQSLSLKNASEKTIAHICNAYKSSDFYTNTHNLSFWLQQSGNIHSPTLPTPLKEEVWFYFMLQHVQLSVYAQMNLTNLYTMLTLASNPSISANFFSYTSEDFCYLQDFLLLKSRFDKEHQDAAAPTATTHEIKQLYKPEELVHISSVAQQHKQKSAQTHPSKDNVAVQSFWSDITSIASSVVHAVVSTSEHAWSDIKQAGQAIAQGAKAAYQGVLGEGAKLINDVKNDAKYVENKVVSGVDAIDNTLKSVQHSFVNDIDQIGSELKEGTEDVMHDLNSAAIGLVNDLKTAGESALNGMESVGRVIAQTADKWSLDTLEGCAQLGDLIANTAVHFYTDTAVGKFLQGCIQRNLAELTKIWLWVKKNAIAGIKDFMKGMAVVTNALTTAIIWCAKTGAYIYAVNADLLGANINPQEAEDKVNNYMQAHRSTINVASGIVLALVSDVLITAVTAGAGAAWAAADIGGMAADVGSTIADTVSTVANAVRTAVSGASDVADVAEEGASAAEGTEGIATAANTASEVSDAAEAVTDNSSEAAKETVTDNSSEAAKENPENSNEENTTKEKNEGNEEQPKDSNKNNQENENSSQSKNRFNKNLFKKLATDAFKKGLLNRIKLLLTLVNVGMNSFSLTTAINTNASAIAQQNQTLQAVQDMWQMNESLLLSAQYNQNSALEELALKMESALGNNMLSLTYMKNYWNGLANMHSAGIRKILTENYLQLLTPQAITDSTSVTLADIGTTWGLTSPFIALYPTPGFVSCTAGRPDFPYAQEVAWAPSNDGTVDTQDANHDQFWFNQKAITTLPQTTQGSAVTVEATIRVIYTLNTPFYFGLYLGGNYHNYTSPDYLKELKTKGADIDAAHLAKMLVIMQEQNQKTPSIGIYEHEGASWLTKSVLPDALTHNSNIYHFMMTLDDTQLTATIYNEENPNQQWTKTCQVQACSNPNTLGIIYSGASIEWNIIHPTLTPPQPIAALRSLTTQPIPEIEREKQAAQIWQQLATPTFGSYKLETPTPIALFNGQYIYQTYDTALETIDKKPILDFVVFAQQHEQLDNIGMQPLENTIDNSVVIVSLLSGNIYNAQRQITGQEHTVYNAYQEQHPTIYPAIFSAIAKSEELYAQQFAHIKVGPFALDAASIPALQSNYNIYTCKKTSPSKTGIDYLQFVNVEDGVIQERNVAYSAHPNGLYSFITQNIYSLQSLIPVTAGNVTTAPESELEIFDTLYTDFKTLHPALHAAIQKETKAYLATKEQAIVATQPTSNPSTGINFNQFSFAKPTSLSNGFNSPAFAFSGIPAPTTKNIFNQQLFAAKGNSIHQGNFGQEQEKGLAFGHPVAQGGTGGFTLLPFNKNKSTLMVTPQTDQQAQTTQKMR